MFTSNVFLNPLALKISSCVFWEEGFVVVFVCVCGLFVFSINSLQPEGENSSDLFYSFRLQFCTTFRMP